MFCSCKSIYKNPIGETIENKIVINNLGKIEQEWNDVLTQNNITGHVSNFIVKSDIDEKTNNKYYYLYSESKDKRIKMVTKLLKHNKKFYLNTLELRYIICHSCSDSYPRIFNKSWACESNNLFDCKKTEVIKF